LTNCICQRYFARVDDKFVTNLLWQMQNSTHDTTSYSSNTQTDYTVKTYVNDTEHKIRTNSRDRLCKSQWKITHTFHTDANNRQDTTQLLDEVFVISRIIKVEVIVILTWTLIVRNITITEFNNCFVIHSIFIIFRQTVICRKKPSGNDLKYHNNSIKIFEI
jgi:archaellum biogenesis ATPase FlaH